MTLATVAYIARNGELFCVGCVSEDVMNDPKTTPLLDGQTHTDEPCDRCGERPHPLTYADGQTGITEAVVYPTYSGWCVRWRTPAMIRSSFRYYETSEQAHRALERLKRAEYAKG